MNRFKINSIYGFKKDNLKIKKSGGAMTVAVEYEVIEPMAGNVSILVAFKDEIKLVGN